MRKPKWVIEKEQARRAAAAAARGAEVPEKMSRQLDMIASVPSRSPLPGCTQAALGASTQTAFIAVRSRSVKAW